MSEEIEPLQAQCQDLAKKRAVFSMCGLISHCLTIVSVVVLVAAGVFSWLYATPAIIVLGGGALPYIVGVAAHLFRWISTNPEEQIANPATS